MKEEKKEMKENKTFDLEIQREVAKIGMTATLGATVVTSMFMKNKLAKNTHVIAGVAFCGFALWHHMLYQTKNNKKTDKLVSK
ncbi:hypothetical protein AAX26_01061 [Aliarcobacter thereius]|uniref:Uncharacterized protein n=3 Tax=Aliarcobacter thereius TaxID=544718 RepID=A0A1C0B6Q3_9BACT|nr:hypothetical protein [Aliarcobacter thereius]OCL86755.1 hypothetical protein AAX26_01061 [Aliarcobacter thereius]OCL90957.1 hypothetical protein AAX25_01125 [Aliarcobacter thereius]OCL96214.1 hypothetical protein AA347_01705 [Aliarcobacter thereius LMG 24486]OCL98924.1 hypothetical protein AAX29_01434 [Aliarcobacter thereius]